MQSLLKYTKNECHTKNRLSCYKASIQIDNNILIKESISFYKANSCAYELYLNSNYIQVSILIIFFALSLLI